MRSRLGSLVVAALAALSCGKEAPAPSPATATRQAAPGGGFEAFAAVTPDEVICGENDCSWIADPGACQQFAVLREIPGDFLDVRLVGPLDAGPNTVTSRGQTYTVTMAQDLLSFGWSATRPVSFVVVTTGQDSNVFAYPTPRTSDAELYGLSASPPTQILLCVTPQPPPPPLTVSATAGGGYTRDHAWFIQKTSPTDTVTAAVGATVDVAYAVSVSATAFDGAFAATGTITLHNNLAEDVTDVTLRASLDGIPFTPTCEGFAGTVPAGTTQLCTWSVPVAAAVDATMVVTVSSPGNSIISSTGDVTALEFPAFEQSASALAAFGGPTAVVDECVTVTDDRAGTLGAVCAAAGPTVFQYVLPVGPYATCEPSVEGYAFANTASYAAPSGETGSSTWSVRVRVPCPTDPGCTLTQGYWKTHSAEGPAPYDARWRNVGPLEEDTVFFLSGKTWLQVFQTPVRGSAYYDLAHQYMAAKLNVLAGASADALGDALRTAEAYFAATTPATRPTVVQRAELSALATLFDQFNNGIIGPGHCQ